MEMYRWVSGARFQGDVQVVGQALKRLQAQTVDDIVRAARATASPLRPLIFDRPPAAAAQEYYRDRARLLVRSIEEIPREDAGADEGYRAFYLVTPGRDEDVNATPNVIVTDEDVLKSPVWRRQVIARLEAMLCGAVKDLTRMKSPLAVPAARLCRQAGRALAQL